MSKDGFSDEKIRTAFHRLSDDAEAIDPHDALVQLRGSDRPIDQPRQPRWVRRSLIGALAGIFAVIAGVVAWAGFDRSTAVTVDQPTTVPVSVDQSPATSNASLDEVARSASIDGVSLLDLTGNDADEVWVAAGCGQTLVYDATMAQTLALTDPEGSFCTMELVEVDGQEALYAIDTVPGPETDGQGEAEPVPVLVRVSQFGDQVLRVFDDSPASLGWFEVDGTDAILAFGPDVFVVDLETDAIRAETELDGSVIALTITDDDVWVATTDEVLALDRTTLEVVQQAASNDLVRQLAATNGDVWGVVDGAVVAISDTELPTPASDEDFLSQRASDGRIWLTTSDALIVFDATDFSEIARVELANGFGPGAFEVNGRTAWLESSQNQEIVRYELSP